jgi:OOP family OmpA-OmpF porin
MRNRLAATCTILALGLVPAITGCHAKAHVSMEAKAPPPPPPAPPPPKEEPPPAPIVDNKIVLPGELEFEVSTATIKETDASLAILNQLAQVLKDNPKITKLRIEGHTDSSGRAKKNMKLSRDRADAVATWLVAHGVDKERLVTVGLGDTRPLADNSTKEGREKNRRTEFHLQEVDSKPVDETSGPVATR